jgi:putative CocE/NonD family hydrolase
MTEYQYLNEAAKLAEKGYIVLNYATRGFGKSGGLIDTAGPKDIADYSAVIDYLIANYPVDPEAIGTGGISYGSGISLIGAALDGRVKAVAALSSWGSLEHALYSNNTPHLAWGELLTIFGDLTGNPDPIIKQHWETVKSQNLAGIPEVIEWAKVRSPITYVDQLNEHGTAIYFGKAYGDNLFQANTLLDMYSMLTGPKHVDLVQGTHATGEILPALLGIGENTLWENSFKWFDIHLKGETNSLSLAQPVQMKVKFQNKFDGYSDFPVPEASEEKFYLHPRSIFDTGDLESYPYQSRINKDNTINSWAGTLMFSTQVPAITQILEQLNVPVLASIPLASKVRSIYFNTGRLDDVMQIRGTPSVTLQVQPKESNLQLVAYLYDMDALGVGKLITHGAYTQTELEAGKKITLDFDLVTTAYDVPAGHRLVIAFDTTDPQYKAPTNNPYNVDFEFSRNKQSVLRVPTL